MNHLQVAMVALTTIAGVYGIVKYACRVYCNIKDQSIKTAQINNRINKDNYQKGVAVDVLEKRLRHELDLITQNHTGAKSLRLARGKSESVYYEWVSENMHLFYITDNVVRIVSVRNGYFQYELPEELKQFTKGKRK